jgi:hypothetical protein
MFFAYYKKASTISLKNIRVTYFFTPFNFRALFGSDRETTLKSGQGAAVEN